MHIDEVSQSIFIKLIFKISPFHDIAKKQKKQNKTFICRIKLRLMFLITFSVGFACIHLKHST